MYLFSPLIGLQHQKQSRYRTGAQEIALNERASGYQLPLAAFPSLATSTSDDDLNHSLTLDSFIYSFVCSAIIYVSVLYQTLEIVNKTKSPPCSLPGRQAINIQTD